MNSTSNKETYEKMVAHGTLYSGVGSLFVTPLLQIISLLCSWMNHNVIKSKIEALQAQSSVPSVRASPDKPVKTSACICEQFLVLKSMREYNSVIYILRMLEYLNENLRIQVIEYTVRLITSLLPHVPTVDGNRSSNVDTETHDQQTNNSADAGINSAGTTNSSSTH